MGLLRRRFVRSVKAPAGLVGVGATTVLVNMGERPFVNAPEGGLAHHDYDPRAIAPRRFGWSGVLTKHQQHVTKVQTHRLHLKLHLVVFQRRAERRLLA